MFYPPFGQYDFIDSSTDEVICIKKKRKHDLINFSLKWKVPKMSTMSRPEGPARRRRFVDFLKNVKPFSTY